MSDPSGTGGPGQPARPDGTLGPGSGYPEYQNRFDPTQPITGQFGGADRPGAVGPAGGSGSQPSPPTRSPRRPRGSLRPLLITLGVVVLAVIVVGAATLYANLKDANVAAPKAPGPSTAAPSTAAPAQPSGNATSMTFTTDDGAGTMTIVSYDWSTKGDPPPTNGNYLELQIEMSATQGTVAVVPSRFQAFDATGNLYQSSTTSAHQPALEDTTLSEGQKTRGWLSYDIDRSDTTVLLGDELGEILGALKVKG